MSQDVITKDNAIVNTADETGASQQTAPQNVTHQETSNGNGSHPVNNKTETATTTQLDNGSAAPSNDTVPPHRSSSKPAMSSSPTALQDMFLNGLRRENIDVVIYFCDGSQERGAVRAFDTFTVLLENRNSGKAQLIYKHAIARIFPTRTPAQLHLTERSGKR